MNKFQQAISIIGGPSAAARLLNVSPQAVCFWRDGERAIPTEICPSIEHATNGAVACEDLLPSVVWVRIPDPDWPNGRPLVDHTQHRKAA